MFDYILISMLNDFIFCPYSIYLHNVYMGGVDELVQDIPQARGKAIHSTIDENKYSTKRNEIAGLSVFSNELGVIGKIDLFKRNEKLLIERKYQLKTIYRGQIYQLWAQYFCMIELGYQIEHLAFYSFSTNKKFTITLPGKTGKDELINFIQEFKQYDPAKPIEININKCRYCIYKNLCDKTNL